MLRFSSFCWKCLDVWMDECWWTRLRVVVANVAGEDACGPTEGRMSYGCGESS